MKPSQYLKKHLLAVCCLITISAGAFAAKGFEINEKLLQTFKATFPDAVQVQWHEEVDMYTVNFYEDNILTKIQYDKDGNFMSSLRYYTEKNLPVNVLCKLQKKYPEKKVFGVTEVTSDATVEYYIKMEDAKNWITVKSNVDGNMQVVEKYQKAA
jgi:hypothetical protein